MQNSMNEKLKRDIETVARFAINHAGNGLRSSVKDAGFRVMDALTALPGGGVALLPIERDRAYERDYIPLPGGWEVQTKGKGSTFRIFDPKDGNRLPIPDVPYLHETLTRMARDIHAALAAPAEDEEKTCRFCGWKGVPTIANDPYTTDGTVEVCGKCNNAECFI